MAKTRHDLMRENLRLRIEIEQMFIDANYWNTKTRKLDESKINPDPDGQLAASWLNLQEEALGYGAYFRQAMLDHHRKYGVKAA